VLRLVLVRHGESIVTVRRVIGGHRTCTGLSDLGIQQAERLARRWAEQPEFQADVVVSSHFARARQTATLVLPALGDMSIDTINGFGEHDPGEACDGLGYQEFLDRYHIDQAVWDSHDPYATTFPGGETVAAFHYRVGAALKSLVDTNPDRTIVVFCHGGVIDAILRQALKAPPMGAFEIHTVNTSITELLLVKPNTWRLQRYNDSAHLAGLPAATAADPAA
jgi:probable phosphoglycerate mutase